MKLLQNLTMFALAFAVIAAVGCNKTPKSASPQDAYKNMAAAFKAKDWEKGCACMTSNSRNELAGGMAMMGSMFEMMGSMPGENAEKMKALAAEGKKLVEKFGVDKLVGDVDMSAGMPDVQKIGAKIKDQPAFIGAMLGMSERMSEAMGQPVPAELKIGEGELTDVKIDGDKATGTLTIGSMSNEISFAKVDGSWLVDLALDKQ